MMGLPEEDAELADAEAAAGTRRRIWVDGQSWIVREIAAPAFDRRGGTHLLFESLEVIRRVRVFPANWMELDDDALYALSQDLRFKRDAERPEDRP